MHCDVVQLHGSLDSLRSSPCSVECIWTREAIEVFHSRVAPGTRRCTNLSECREQHGKRAVSIGSLQSNSASRVLEAQASSAEPFRERQQG